MHNIEAAILDMTLDQLGLESEAGSIASGVTKPIVDGIDPAPGGQPTPESEKFRQNLQEFIEAGRKDPEAHTKAVLAEWKQKEKRDLTLTVRQVITGWEKHYAHHKSHRPSVMIAMFKSGMAEFFKKLREFGVTEEQLGQIAGAKEQVEYTDHCNRLRDENFRAAQSRGYV